MPEQFKAQWKQYRKECAERNITPTIADFLGVTFTDEEYNCGLAKPMRWKACLARRSQMAASA